MEYSRNSARHCRARAPIIVGVVSRAAAALLLAAITPARAADNDYPTAARADYVFGCMAANGNTREALLKCSCAIDTIAGLMPYSHYEQAETALSGGHRRVAACAGRGEPAVPIGRANADHEHEPLTRIARGSVAEAAVPWSAADR